MNRSVRSIKSLVLVALASTSLFISNCGKKTDADNMSVNIAPESPTIGISPFTKYINAEGDTIVYQPNWYQVFFYLKNRTPDDVVINSIKLEHRVKVKGKTVVDTDSATLDTPGALAFAVVEKDNKEDFVLQLYVSGLPTNTDNYVYKAKVTFMGWYGTLNAPGRRFEKTITYVTN